MARDLEGLEAARDVSWMEGLWVARDTTPGEIEAALRELIKDRHAESASFVPARVLNLVVIADREWRGEIQNRLEQVGRYHASRTILCAVEQGRTTIDAAATMIAPEEPPPGELAVCHEEVVLDVGPQHLARLDAIVDAVVVSDIATLVWSPHGHADAVDSLKRLAQTVLLDSVNEPDPASAVQRAKELSQDAYIVDLAWLRSTPWRERVASTFDPPQWRAELGKISAVTVHHRPDSAIAGLLFFGWLGTKLNWEPGEMIEQGGSLHGKAHARKGDVTLTLDPEPSMSAPGLASVTIETQSGMSISLDRGSGGLSARRTTRDGEQSEWTVLGASRGEAGILGEGIRQALLRDHSYQPALDAAERMVA